MVLYVGPLVYIFFILNPFKVNQPVTRELDQVKTNFSEDLNLIKTNQTENAFWNSAVRCLVYNFL